MERMSYVLDAAWLLLKFAGSCCDGIGSLEQPDAVSHDDDFQPVSHVA